MIQADENTGESDTLFSGEDLIAALEHLDLGPTTAEQDDDDDDKFFLEDLSLPDLQFTDEDVPFGEDLLHVFDDPIDTTLDDSNSEQEEDENLDPLSTTSTDLHEEELHNSPPAVTPEQLLDQLENLTLDDMPDEIRYCQPCDDPNAIPPSPFVFPSEALSAAAAVLAEEFRHAATTENEAFWQEQMALLQQNNFQPLPPQDNLPSPEDMMRGPLLDEEPEQHYTLPPLRASQRPGALQAAAPYIEAFASRSQRECWGHKERILGSALSPNGTLLATASQDSTLRLWSMATHKQVAVLQSGSKDHEMLRVAWDASGTRLAGGGADGNVLIWENKQDDDHSKWTLVATIDHGLVQKEHITDNKTNTTHQSLTSIPEDEQQEKKVEEDTKEDDPPQVYSLQFIKEWKVFAAHKDSSPPRSNDFLMTSSDDFVHLWELQESTGQQLHPHSLLSLHFGHINSPGYGVTLVSQNKDDGATCPQHTTTTTTSSSPFGGARNPDNIVFVFDASYCSANDILGVALSDGSLRLVNSRGVGLAALSLPGCQSHLTSFAWDSLGQRIATTVATGHVIVWGIFESSTTEQQRLNPSCRAIFQGGHIPGRPVFGACFVSNDELLLSWGGDGRLCLWDGQADEELDAPLAVLHDYEDGYPVYSIAVTKQGKGAVAIAGGGAIGGFLGVPAYLVDLDSSGASADEQLSKRPKTS